MIDLDALALERRDRLPDALRVLMEDYPRDAWEADPGFTGMVEFWMQRHMMFRQVLGTMETEAQQALDRAMEMPTWAARLSRYGGFFVNELHMHHSIEDHHYFPVLKQKDARIGAGFDLLDRDHHAIDPLLHGFAEVANTALNTLGRGPDAAAPVASEIARLTRLLDRHLTDEEELVVPVILRYGTAGLP